MIELDITPKCGVSLPISKKRIFEFMPINTNYILSVSLFLDLSGTSKSVDRLHKTI
jgi:hypothetical protein